MEVDELIETVKSSSDSFAATLGPDGDWSPMLFVDAGGELSLAVLEVSMDDKATLWSSTVPNVVRALAKGEVPDAVVMLVSAWRVEYEPGEYDEAAEPTPSEHPNRVECLALIGVSTQGEAGATARIVRGGEHPELEWDTDRDGLTFSGDMVAGLRQAVWS